MHQFMTKSIFAFFVFSYFTLFALAQNEYEQERLLPHFNEIWVSSNIDLQLVDGTSEKAVIIGTKGIHPSEVITQVSGGTLKIKISGSIYRDSKRAKVLVTYDQLHKIKASAGAEVSAGNPIEHGHLKIIANTGAIMELTVAADDLEVSASEGAEVMLRGIVNSIDASTATGGMIEAFDLESKHAYARAGTGGHTELTVLNSIEATAVTGGIVRYKGAPDMESVKTRLGGEVQRQK